jgi:uroporphyrinogen decarboxylase
MPPLSLSQFWIENEACFAFTTAKPRCALAFSPDDHWLFELLPVESTLRYYKDKPYRDELHRQANALTLEGVGKAFFDEDTWETNPKRIENLFGSEFAYTEGGTPWLQHVTDDPVEFARVLDHAEATDVAAWALPVDYRAEWEARKAAGKPLPSLGTGSRGPATIMTSVLHPENVFLWMYDHPELMARFRDILARKMVELNRVLRAFSGFSAASWWITDDNCALFNRKLYREYCVPVLQTVLDEFAPIPSRVEPVETEPVETGVGSQQTRPMRPYRYQHSDSSMGHLLDAQNALGMTSVNYGPDVDAALIRQKLPDAIINGQMPPFLLRNGTDEEVRLRVRSDFEKAGATGGLVIATAGSLAAGTTIDRMRWLMWCVQEETRYR